MNSLPHVSDILRIMADSYADVPVDTLRMAQERGSALHGLCCQHLASMMDLCPKPAEIEAEYVAGYTGFLGWLEKRRFKPVLVEQSSLNEEDGYLGTPDTFGTYGDDPAMILPDLKFTAAILPINHVQVQAYLKLKAYRAAKKGVLVHIDPYTGDWEEVPVKPNPRDWIAFKSALNLFHWRAA